VNSTSKSLRVVVLFALFAVPSGASAQVQPGVVTANTITVAGRATILVPPDRLRVLVRLSPRNVTGEQLEALAASVADAMHAGGIADAKAVLPIAGYLGSNATIAIVGSVAKPTRESVEAILRATLKAVPDATATALGTNYQVQSSYSVSDCSDAEARAQQAAIADARARAERVATAAGLHLGPIISVNEGSAGPAAGCFTDPDTAYGAAFGNQDPYGAIAIPVNVFATVVFGTR